MALKNIALLFFILYLLPHRASGQSLPYQTTVSMHVPVAPAPVMIGGHPSLHYELHLTNFAGDTLKIMGLNILNAGDSSTISKLDENSLPAHFTGLNKDYKSNTQLMPPGASGVIFIDFSLPGNVIPKSLIHQLKLTILNNKQTTPVFITGAATEVVNNPPVMLGPPLASGPWAAVYDPLWATGHRRVFYTIDGTARLPGRFAIDFIKLDSAGKLATGDENLVSNWHGYAADVLAVHDGIVASVRNDAKESTTLSAYVAAAPENAAGNYISLKIGDNQYVFYEHLKPGSIRVKPGQKVVKGQIIASLGFTGQTTGPHLHLHVADKNSALGAEGLPFEFESYQLLGQFIDLSNFGNTLWTPSEKQGSPYIRRERPAPNSVIVFKN